MSVNTIHSTVKRLVLFGCMTALLPLTSHAEAAGDGYTSLFNGKDLIGWSGNSEVWSVNESGEIEGTTHDKEIINNTFLSTANSYSDFVLEVSVKIESGNSGIQFRSAQHLDHVIKGYQADVAIDDTYFGMLYEEGGRGFMPYWEKLSDDEKKAINNAADLKGWNEYVVTCKGDQIKMVLNGQTVLDLNDPAGAKDGVIALQLHHGPSMRVFFKDIKIKELKK